MNGVGEHKGRVVLVTGSTSGIGLDIARVFVQEGAHVIINGLGTQEDIARAVSVLSKLGEKSKGSVSYVAADLTSEEEISALVQHVCEKYQRIDILVNNAGMQYVAPIEEFPSKIWDKIISLNLTATFHLARLCLPVMRAHKFGRIVNVASTHGLVASANKSAYVASKHGIVGLTKVIALETALENITCNAICPGFVLTPLVEAQVRHTMKTSGLSFEEACAAFVSDKHPSHAFANSEDIAAACLYLSSQNAGQIRGTTLAIDGGWTIQ